MKEEFCRPYFSLGSNDHILVGETLCVTDLINSTSCLLSNPAAARSKDLGEVLPSSKKMGNGDFTPDAECGSQWLVNFGQLFSLRL